MDTPTHTMQVPEELDGQRFDQVLARLFPDYSRSRLKQWVLRGRARLDGAEVAPKSRVRTGQTIELTPEVESVAGAKAEPIELDVVHEDADMLVINKPAGLVVHPGAGNPDGTLVNGLLNYAPELDALPRAGLVHRLDKNTSGLLLIARSQPAHTQLVRALEAREIRREYRAVCVGRLTAGGTIDQPIARHPNQRTKMAVTQRGKPAVTHYRVLKRFSHNSFIAVRLETGRTHQIRVHLAHQHRAIVGDPMYGGRLQLPAGGDEHLMEVLRNFRRQALHASQLRLEHPVSGESLSFRSTLPEDFRELLEALAQGESTADEMDALQWPE